MVRYEFNASKNKKAIVKWIADFFEKNGRDCKAVIAISGGKDSSVVAALCVEALGRDRVFGVLLPNGEQKDIDASKLLVSHLGIDYCIINIENSYKGLLDEIGKNLTCEISNQTVVNLPARLRMATIYAVAQSINGRVANTCNLSEDWVGYATRYGDSAGDFSPLSKLTVTEVKQIGYELGLPAALIEKKPEDGLCGKTDEENLGFSYDDLDKCIRLGKISNQNISNKIAELHDKNLFKLMPMPRYTPLLTYYN